MKGFVDYHMHTPLCGHAVGQPEEYVRRALDIGLREIGFSDHLYLYHLPAERRDPELAMREEELPRYVEWIRAVQERAPHLPIRLGIEADYIPGHEARLAEILGQCDFDYVYGSVHFIGEWGLDDPRYVERYAEWDVDALYERYFELVIAAASTGLFDVMAHLDLVKKFGYRPRRDLAPLYRDLAAALKAADVVVEVSTAGLRKPVGEIYPSRDLLAACCKAGVPVTLGSDAHRPEEVGYAFDRAVDLLREVGYRTYVAFHRRRREARPLPSSP
ncbi:MAG TPA: histidinol-phosphatase HisJ family protein [Chloroflexota bacterium]